MDNIEEDYPKKAKTIFHLLNGYRRNPKQLAHHLTTLKSYLDPSTNILSEPNKIQIQMVEGEDVFNDAISFLNSLPSLKPFIWDDNLAQSANEHVNDIGPKGLLIYQSSDGLEPEDRIAKYGKYVDSLGENIDFGPNDAMGVIVSMTLDDGEEQRPHRENLFKGDYQKIGIACGAHQSEFQMCVMDFAYDFIPLKQIGTKKKGGVGNVAYQGNLNNNNVVNNSMYNEPVVNLNLGNNSDMIRNNMGGNSNNNMTQIDYGDKHMQHAHNPYVKLSLDNEDFMKVLKPNVNMNVNNNSNMNMNLNTNVNNNVNMNNALGNQQFVQGGGKIQSGISNEDIGMVNKQVWEINKGKKVVKKTVEIVTKITYIYEDGSQREVMDKKCHDYN